jgi:EmrB/QacA subfamily drug resistance transporter
MPTSRSAVLAVAALTTFMTPFMISAVNIALPTIQREFATDAVTLPWIANAYLLAVGILLLPAGRIADIHGRRRVYTSGILLFTLCNLATALAPSVGWVIALRVAQGVGGAMIMANGMAIIAAVFPPRERGRAIGITVAAVYVGLSAGPFAGGLLASTFGWRSIFLATGPVGLAAYGLALFTLREEWADARGERFDLRGSLLYGLGLLGVMAGLASLPTPLGLLLLAGGLLGLALFIKAALKSPAPVFELRLFARNRTFTFSSLAALINYAATFAVSFLLSLYLQSVKGLTPREAGTVLVCQPLVQAMLSPWAGRLSDRVEPALIASVGMAFTACGLVVLVFLDSATPLPAIIATLFLLGLGFALFSSPNMNAIMGSVDKRFYGVASGTVATMRLMGQMLSISFTTLIFRFTMGAAPIAAGGAAPFLRALHGAFSLFALFCLTGIYFSLARGTLRPAAPQGGQADNGAARSWPK